MSDMKHPIHQVQEEGKLRPRSRPSPWAIGTGGALVAAVVVGGAIGVGLRYDLALRNKTLATW